MVVMKDDISSAQTSCVFSPPSCLARYWSRLVFYFPAFQCLINLKFRSGAGSKTYSTRTVQQMA